MFNVNIFRGVSEPDDNDEVDEGDNVETLVETPRANKEVLSGFDIPAVKFAFVRLEFMEGDIVWLRPMLHVW